METHIYRYEFDDGIPASDIESSLAMAIVSVEALHGESETLMDVQHLFDPEQRQCVIRADTPAGRDLARLFTGYLQREFGPESFRVERVTEPALQPTEA